MFGSRESVLNFWREKESMREKRKEREREREKELERRRTKRYATCHESQREKKKKSNNSTIFGRNVCIILSPLCYSFYLSL